MAEEEVAELVVGNDSGMHLALFPSRCVWRNLPLSTLTARASAAG